jgi:transcriptional regulator with XRE-family HTH domain
LAKALQTPIDRLIFGRPLAQELAQEPSLGRRLKKARLARGFSLEELSKRLGHKSHMAAVSWETEKFPVSKDKWKKLAGILKVDLRLLRGYGKASEMLDDALQEEKSLEPAA